MYGLQRLSIETKKCELPLITNQFNRNVSNSVDVIVAINVGVANGSTPREKYIFQRDTFLEITARLWSY